MGNILLSAMLAFMHREPFLAALAAFVLLSAPLSASDPGLIESARKLKGPALSAALVNNFEEKALNEGSAFVQDHGRFLFAVRSASRPQLNIDDRPAGAMKPVKGSDLWTLETKLATGRSHAIEYSADGKPIGRRLDIRAYTDLHYPRAGVAQGKVSEKQAEHEQDLTPAWSATGGTTSRPASNPASPRP
ncbi:MAG: hypothetical protein R2748_01310 [Bryobacterales bacterium]